MMMHRATCFSTCLPLIFLLYSLYSASCLAQGQATEEAAPAASKNAASDLTLAAEKPTDRASPGTAAPAQRPTPEPPAADAQQSEDQALKAWARALAKKSDRLTVGDIAEVKHYKIGALQGFGLVLDLEGLVGQRTSRAITEEAAPADAMKLPELLQLLNQPPDQEKAEVMVPQEFWAAGRVTLVSVTATIPPEGVCEGDRIDCEVKSFGNEDLEGGYLLSTPLYPPGPKADTPSAMAAGPVVQESSVRSAGGKVLSGCLVREPISDEFVKDQRITLVLNEDHADFLVAQDIAVEVNLELGVNANQPLAKALSRHTVDVIVPEPFAEDPVSFVTQVLQLPTKIPVSEGEEQ
jgi:flagellar basal body P-ring protein FlgI